jgi:hypothetical protein
MYKIKIHAKIRGEEKLHMNCDGACFDGYHKMEHIRRYKPLQGMDRMQLNDGFQNTSRGNDRRKHETVMRRSKAFCQSAVVGGDEGDGKRASWAYNSIASQGPKHVP